MTRPPACQRIPIRRARHRRIPVVAAGLATAYAVAATFGGLVIDVRAVSATGTTQVLNAKHVVPGAAGDVVTCDVWAIVTALDPYKNNDGMWSVSGSFLSANVSGNGSVRGKLSAARLIPYLGGGGSNGLEQDLDADGDVDVGSNVNTSAAGFFAAHHDLSPTPVTNPARFATVSFSIGQVLSLNDVTTINFRPRSSASAAVWWEDGIAIVGSDFSAGAPVEIFIPEPASVALPCLTGLSLLARGSRAIRRCSSST